MSTIKILTRLLWVLLVLLVLAVLIWRFAFESSYFYYSIGAGVVITGLAAFVIFKFVGKTRTGETVGPAEAGAAEEVETDEPIEGSKITETRASIDVTESVTENGETIPVEDDYTDIPPLVRKRMEGNYQGNVHRLDASEVSANYRRMAGKVSQDIVSDPIRPSIIAASLSSKPVKQREEPALKPESREEETETEAIKAETEDNGGQEPPIPMIEDQSSLTLEEINALVNAVWYRCENPYCKYTTFLTVHHFVDEKDGGSNKLDNLIVLCPYCHDLAHKNEMPENEMREWISREDRFKSKPDWPH
jgi:5-methylcytosine-specific restriction endonuclease McrA